MTNNFFSFGVPACSCHKLIANNGGKIIDPSEQVEMICPYRVGPILRYSLQFERIKRKGEQSEASKV